MSDIELHLLGPLRVWRDGVELTLGSARRMAVLGVLALRAGQAVSRDELVSAVWGEDAPASATGNVYTYVSALRQLLEPDRDRWAAGQLLASAGGTYQLNLPRQAIDVFRFEAEREAAQRHRHAGNTAAELAAIESALGRWRGEALAGVPGPFAGSHRLRLAELRLATARRHAALLGEADRPEDQVELLRDLVEQHPDLDYLRADLAAAEGATAPADDRTGSGTPGGPPATGPSRAHRLVGRDAELRRLRRAVADAARGHGGAIRIEGAAGEGKSALLAAALRGAVPDGCRVGRGTADELSQRVPGGVLLECLESALGADEPLLAELLSGTAEVDRVVARLGELAGTAPLVLVVDDVQWADALSLRVWAALGAGAGRLPLLLVSAARTGSDAARALPADEVVTLAPLDPAAATALVRAAAPMPPEGDLLARILDDAGGNPYYLRHLAAAGDGGTDRMDAAAVAAVGVHLAPLPEACRQVLRTIAFLGGYDLLLPGGRPGCAPAGLAAVYDGDAGELARALDPALRAGILVMDGDRLVFRHRVVARALHQGTPAAVRATVHRSFADRIAAAGGPPEQVAGQLLAGDVPFDQALAGWLAGHVETLVERAPRLALAVLRQARSQRVLDPAQRVLLTAWLARLLLREELNAVAEASWVASRTTDPELEGEMRWVAATSHERGGDFQAASDVAWAAVRELRVPARWMERLRAVIGRARPHLEGEETQTYSTRSVVGRGDSLAERAGNP